MKLSIYDYRNYKTYILDLIESHPSGSRGQRKQLAEAMGCQVSHVTNVLSGSGHFSQEQIEAASRFFGLNIHEIEFLLLLVQYNRAGTKELSQLYFRFLEDKRGTHSTLKKRLDIADELKSEHEAKYYSGWQFSAIHMLLTIPSYQTRESIAQKLGLTLRRVDEVLSFLVDVGLAVKEGQKYKPSRKTLHLDKTSDFISKHHINWRLRGMMALESLQDSELHYSSVITLSKKDYLRVKEVLTKALSESLKIAAASPEEEIVSLCMDFYSL